MLPSYPPEKRKLNHISTVDVEQRNHPVVIVVSPLNALDQIDVKKHENASRKTQSFLKAKLRQSLEKSWTKISIIFVQRTVLADSCNQIARRPGPASQYRMEVSNMFAEYFNLCP